MKVNVNIPILMALVLGAAKVTACTFGPAQYTGPFPQPEAGSDAAAGDDSGTDGSMSDDGTTTDGAGDGSSMTDGPSGDDSASDSPSGDGSTTTDSSSPTDAGAG
jgi:hypothetical protein